MLFWDRAGARVMVVSHAGTMRMFRYLLERWTHDDVVERGHSEPISNCAVIAYRFDSSAGRLVPVDPARSEEVSQAILDRPCTRATLRAHRRACALWWATSA